MTIDTTADIIDVRDIIERIEKLENNEEGIVAAPNDVEYRALYLIMDSLKGNGGDEQWRGDWYPLQLVRDYHFKDYAQELADDIGALDDAAKWPYTCIDWNQAASELKHDYTSTQVDGVTYWYR